MAAVRIEDLPQRFQAQVRAQLDQQATAALAAVPPPPQTEQQVKASAGREIKEVHEPLKQWLALRGLPYVYARPDKPSGLRQGWPDFGVIIPGGRLLAIECKAGSGRLRLEQVAVRVELENHGVPYCLAYTAKAAIDFVREQLGELNTTTA